MLDEMTDVKLSGKKMIHRKVKSFEGKDLGKIESITADYIEVKDGDTHYFIPKLHVKEFDKDNLFVLLPKDEIKEKYKRDNPPLGSEIQQIEDSDKPEFAGYHKVIPFMAKEPDLQLKGEQSGTILTIPWEDVIHKHVRTADNNDIGDVDQVGNEFIVVRDGVVNVHMYYIPKQYIIKYDGSSLWIDVTSGLVSAKFERDKEPTQEEIDMLINEVPDKAGSHDEGQDRNYNEAGGKEPMNPEDIASHEPTAVKRDEGAEIRQQGQSGIDSAEAREKYKKSGITEAK